MSLRKNKLPELLSPCGSREALDAAITGGADAVYFGGEVFNARMNAKNFGRDEISAAVSECHRQGVRAYVTLNTLIYDREILQALEYASFLYKTGADALIVTDPGLVKLIREHLPDFELHASTQVTAHNIEAVNRLAAGGFSRVVGARELSLDNIRKFCLQSDAAIELFVHGAICVSCSGQCLMSSMLGGRSGNRGECAQPCRMSYNKAYPLSLKDMCLAEHIPELIDCGAASLKIEGRMKSPQYVYGVTKIYRRLLDERRGADGRETAELTRIFSRGGFTDAYFTGKPGASMLGVRSEKDIAVSRGAEAVPKTPDKPRLPLITVSERVGRELPSKLVFPAKKAGEKPFDTARFVSASQIPEKHGFKHIYLPLSKYESAADGVILPPVIFDSELDGVKRKLSRAAEKGATRIMLCNIGQLSLAAQFGLVSHGDFRLNVYNSLSANKWAEASDLPLESLILSCELTLPQIRDINFIGDTKKAAVVYGRIPLMLLEKPLEKTELRDTKGAVFPIVRDEGRDIVLNSVPIYMADRADKLREAGIEERHFIFTIESRAEATNIINAYSRAQMPKGNIRRIK